MIARQPVSEIPEWALRALLSVGLKDPNPRDPVHVEMVNAILEVGPTAPEHVRLQRLRWSFNHMLRDAGSRFANAKADVDDMTGQRVADLLKADTKLSVARAQALVAGDVEIQAAQRAMLIAQQLERALRKFLDTIEVAVDLYRTSRADERRADTFHTEVAP